MKKIELKPVVVPKEYADAVEAILIAEFRAQIYLPLMRELRAPRELGVISLLKNSTDRDKLVDALMKGTIYYYRGVFKGKFSAETIKEMRRLKAIYDDKLQGWKVPQEKIPHPIQTAINNSQGAFDRVVDRLQKKIDSVIPANFAGSINLEKIFEKIIYKVDDKVQDTILGLPGTKKIDGHVVLDETVGPTPKSHKKSKGSSQPPKENPAPFADIETKQKVLSQIVISPKFDEEQVSKIAKEYNNNMKLSIKGWTEEKVKELRSLVQEKVMNGERYEGLAKIIQESYGTTQSKAQFLARQETNLLTTKMKETRYESAGVSEYKWRCVAGSKDHPVRPMHKIHDNKIFRFDNPPIVDKKGNRKNPGEDYNCRCVAVPIVRFDDKEDSD